MAEALLCIVGKMFVIVCFLKWNFNINNRDPQVSRVQNQRKRGIMWISTLSWGTNGIIVSTNGLYWFELCWMDIP